jgi:F420H(2)-dependent quinone reductase
VTIELGADAGVVERFDGTAATATDAERDRLFGILAATRPEIAAHQDRTDRQIPLVVVQYQQRGPARRPAPGQNARPGRNRSLRCSPAARGPGKTS